MSLLRTWFCQRFHNVAIEKRVSEQSRKLTCSCGRQYACHDWMGVIVPWSEEFAEMYARFDRHRSRTIPPQESR